MLNIKNTHIPSYFYISESYSDFKTFLLQIIYFNRVII